MKGIDTHAASRARLWAVNRKQGLRRPNAEVRHARGRHIRGFAAVTKRDYQASLSGAELELAQRHFDDQHLREGEIDTLTAAILDVVNRGGVRSLGPMGRSRRRYELARLSAGIRIRSGEAAMSLPLTSAVRLAGQLGLSRDTRRRGAPAAGADR